MLDLGYRLEIARKMKKLTRSQLAEMVDAAGNTIKNIEKGWCQPRIDLLAKIAVALGVSINWLIFGNHPPKADRELMTKLVLYEKRLEA